MSNTVRLMIAGGIIPAECLQQLERWKLLPPGYDSQSGELELNWESSEDFVDVLSKAIHEEACTIRETDLDKIGHHRTALLYLESTESMPWKVEVFVDRLDRVIVPAAFSEDGEITHIELEDLRPQKVVRIEPRYEGETHTTWVCYLEERNVVAEETTEPVQTN